VAAAKRDVLLRVHRHRLRREDLEDCYGQATLELIVLARRGRAFAGRRHIANALEQRFLARVLDRRRAIAGRSPIAAAIEGAVPFASEGERLELADTREEPERLVIAREELARVLRHMSSLTPDQRMVLATQIALAMRCEEFCRRHGWTPEKYRKVAQRGRAKLRDLLAAEDSVAPAVPLAAEVSEQTPGTHL
jgi:DNA-directed RNA polymerase specialized sigma24 family protein